jgi:hypothetical protein
MTYWAVSDLKKSELREFARQVQEQVSLATQALTERAMVEIGNR